MVSRRLVLGMNKMMKGGGAFNLPIFKRMKKKNMVSRRKITSKGNIGGGRGIITTTASNISSSSSNSTSFGIGRCTTSSTISNNYSNNDWFVFEILTRLPVKSLFRFKSVSKNWCSLIQKDQQVMDLHFTRSKTRLPRIFIVLPLPPTEEEERKLRKFGRFLYSRKKKLHITADLMSEEEQVYNNNGVPTGRGTKLKLVVDTIREINKPSYHTISKPVNGLICLIDKYTKPVARICNISTGELSPWFPLNHCIDFSYYGFGFDPSTNEYKLLYVWMDDDTNVFGDVLTIGHSGIKNNSTWRRIEEVPQNGLTKDNVYVNGVIYWYPGNYPTKSFELGDFIVAFDVGSEKFRIITIPHFVLRDIQIPDDDSKFDSIGKLVEVNGSLAMVVRLNNQTFKMYLCRDDNKYKEGETINGMCITSFSRTKNGRWREKKGRWSEVSTITLPFQMRNDHRVKFHTFVGSHDKIFITSSILGMGKKKCVSIYCYNWKKFSLTEVDVSGIPPLIPQLCPQSFFATFSESLLSIDS